MSKIIERRGRNAEEQKSIDKRTEEISADLKFISGSNYIKPKHLALYIGCVYITAYNYLTGRTELKLPPPSQSCGMKRWFAKDVARWLANMEVTA